MPSYFKRISSAIDELPPDLDFEVSELQGSENQNLSQQIKLRVNFSGGKG
jgi:hypothetical protein